MLIPDSSSLTVIFGFAATAGVVHTLAGPDHYLPLVAIARERRWSAVKASLVTLIFGLAHCLASVALVFGLAVTAGALDVLASTAAWLMVGVGCCMVILAMRRRRARAQKSGITRIVPVLAGLAFLIGPCEWLIPVATTVIGSLGVLAALQVCVVYTLCTVGTMWLATSVAIHGLDRLAPRNAGVIGSVIGGAACTVCGVLMMLGL